ncbi:MATE family efflux transporter [Aureimonas sp. Leaf324]|jgi:MATE family multidrug resistance protein|uniref:MATE family efflux transporter n=1 Tax=Aureimonas sp. Leaf324 TaxID=1736336 RepID=UPI0006FDC225|nr:MATE family efflux transporter [Aureimonas sp. Leaf324]KQQ91100.1 MATE family efflux transporter [Aureimonas sp. Leaf324]
MVSLGANVEGGAEAPTSWGAHLRGMLLLGLPLIGAQLAQMSINVTNTILIGRLGPVELAAAVLTSQTFYVFWMFGSGFAYAVMPMAAAANGRRDTRAVRRSVRMGLWVVAAYSAVVMIPLWFTHDIFVALGQDPRVAELGGHYMRILQWSMLPYLATFVLRSYLSALERPRPVLVITVLGALINGLANYALIFGNFGLPALGLTGSGIASVTTSVFILAALVVYTRVLPALAPYDLWRRFHLPDWEAFAEVARLGWPIGATIVAEVGLFTAASVMMGWIGTVELAAHGIALQLASISFMVPLGLSSAATVRVGSAYGRGSAEDVSRAARVAMMVAIGIAFFAALLFWMIPERLIGLYLDLGQPDAARVLATAIPLLFVAAAFQLIDAMQVTASGVLRGLKDTRTPMLIAVGSYWAVGMPIAYTLAFPLGWQGIGVWWGLAAGLAVAAFSMTARYLQRERSGQVTA